MLRGELTIGDGNDGGILMHRMILILLGMAGLMAAAADTGTQTDWAGGDGVLGPVNAWDDCFAGFDGASWRAIPGQLCLAGVPLATPQEELIDATFDGPVSLFTCDLDGDGDNDLVGAARHANQIAYWRNEGGTPLQWTFLSIDDSIEVPLTVHAADIDGDGDLDVIGGGYDEALVAWYRNDGGRPIVWTKQIIDDDFPGAHQVYAEDVDNDGRPDVVCCTQGENRIAWWRNVAGQPEHWPREIIVTGFLAASSVYVTDVDGDGLRDVLGAGCSSPGKITMWRNRGGMPIDWERQDIDPDCALAHWVHAADMDRDGDTDVVGVSYTGNRIQWWRNEGGDPIQWTELNVTVGIYRPLVAHAADLDGDGDCDIMGTSGGGNKVFWYENDDGLGTAWVTHPVDTYFSGAWPGHVGDLDGDGALDIVAAAETVDNICWWRITSFEPCGTLTSSILDTEAMMPTDGQLDWDAQIPAGTGLGVQVRTGDAPGELGPWSELQAVSGPLGFDLGRFLQYRVQVTTQDSLRSPILKALELSWTSQGSAIEGDLRDEGALHLRVPSPVRGAIRIEYRMPPESPGHLAIYDAAGRLARRIVIEDAARGELRIPAGSLTAGIYWCAAQTAQAHKAVRFVLVN